MWLFLSPKISKANRYTAQLHRTLVQRPSQPFFVHLFNGDSNMHTIGFRTCTPSDSIPHGQVHSKARLRFLNISKLDWANWNWFFCFLDAHRPCVHAADFFQFKNKITHWMNLNTYLYIYPPLNARRAERRRAVPCWEDGDAEQFRIRNQRPGQRVRSWTLFIIYILHLPLSHILT